MAAFTFVIAGGLGGAEALLQESDIGIDGGKAVEPMAAQPGEFADGNIGNIDPFGSFGQSGPGGARGAVKLERLLERGAVARALVYRIQNPGAEFGGEEFAQAGLNRDIDVRAAVLHLPRGTGQIFQPLRDLDGRILAAPLALEQLAGEVIDAGEELRVERAGVAESLAGRECRCTRSFDGSMSDWLV